MRWIVAIFAVIGLMMAGCFQVSPQPALPPTNMTSWGPMGGFTMSSGTVCAGHATLNGGYAAVNDSCFTSSDNIVLCTDTTAANPVKCMPAYGYLSIAGAASDTIAYARVR